MRKFKIIALSCGGVANKVYNSQELVNEDGFVAENIEALIEQKFIEEVLEEQDMVEEKPKEKKK